MCNSFLFLGSFRSSVEAFDAFDRKLGDQLLWAIVVYGIEHKDADNLHSLVKATLCNLKPYIDNSNTNYFKSMAASEAYFQERKEKNR